MSEEFMQRAEEKRNEYINFHEAAIKKYGSYREQYDKQTRLRNAIEKKYIRYKWPWGTYRRNYVANTHGKYIDHHILSYLAPFDFVRIGWGGIGYHHLNR